MGTDGTDHNMTQSGDMQESRRFSPLFAVIAEQRLSVYTAALWLGAFAIFGAPALRAAC